MDVNNEVLNIDATGSTDMQAPVAETLVVEVLDAAQHDTLTQTTNIIPAETSTHTMVDSREASSPFSSLYETFNGTIVAVALGLGIIVGIQTIVSRIFTSARSMSDNLTTFATTMVSVLVAIYVCDLLIAGPDVTLLREAERTTIVTFIKDISLMCFSYYFGSKTNRVSTPPEV
jgi:hypothetical protein